MVHAPFSWNISNFSDPCFLHSKTVDSDNKNAIFSEAHGMLSNSTILIPAGFVMHTAQEVQFMKLSTIMTLLFVLESSVKTYYFVMVAYYHILHFWIQLLSSSLITVDIKSVKPQPCDKETLFQAIKKACRDIEVHLCHLWIQHSHCSLLKSITWETYIVWC